VPSSSAFFFKYCSIRGFDRSGSFGLGLKGFEMFRWAASGRAVEGTHRVEGVRIAARAAQVSLEAEHV
jgi:hypothetical protein